MARRKRRTGETWRYALGEGWVAARYVRPDPSAVTGFGTLKGLLVTTSDNVETTITRVDANGKATAITSFRYQPQGIGGVPPGISPSGQYFAYSQEEGYKPTTSVGNLVTGEVKKYPGTYFQGWSSDDKLSLTVNETCPQVCGTWAYGWLDPNEAVVHKLDGIERNSTALFWGHDGKSFIVVTQNGGIVRIGLDGGRTTIRSTLPDGFQFGEMSISADGSRVLSSALFGKIQVVDLRTGSLATIERAKQIQVAGKCGGASGRLSGWLDATSVIWHESYAEKGGNGITMSGIDGSNRRLTPLFSIQDVRGVAPGLVSFTTIESDGDRPRFPLTWLLDVKTGEARPVSVGFAGTWVR